MKKADIISGLIGIAIGAYVLLSAMNFPKDLIMKIGPGFYPSFLAGGIIICSLVLIIKAFIGQSIGEYDPITLKNSGIRRVSISIAVIIIYCALLDLLGFIIATIPFIIIFMRMFGKHRIWEYAAVSIGITAGTYLVFEKVLLLTLPAGLLRIIL